MRILLVDDDKPLRAMLAENLREQQYAVDVATDGEAAWNYLVAFSYDLVVLDVMLPKLNGVNLCRQLRSEGYEMPILLLTAKDSSIDKVEGLNAGADDYVVKPFNSSELTARIRALLRRESQALPPILHWQSLSLDTNTCEAFYKNQPLHLTPKERALLEMFLRHPSQVFSPGKIIENLWTFEDPPGEEAVRTHIKGLRQKLKQAYAPRDLVKTVYGIGYRLKPIEQATPTKTSAPKAQKKDSATLAAVTKAWSQFKGAMYERLIIIEKLVNALAQGSLSSELQEQARGAAHKLAGSLGSFGFPQGSKLAAKLENLLQTAVEPSQIEQLNQLLESLRREIEHQPFESKPEDDQNPLLLIVDDDPEFTQCLAEQAKNWQLQTAIASTETQAKDLISCFNPAVVLLKLVGGIELLGELHQQLPSLPIVVITDESNFTERLEIIRQGARLLLTQPTTPSQILKTVTQVLRRSGAGVKIMIVDDDKQVLKALETNLAPWGFELTLLDDPHCFWEVLEAVTPDLLVLDVEMPDISGIELCQVLRSDPSWSRIPVIFLTVHKDTQTQNQAFAIGADDYVSKPVIDSQLVNRIFNRLERTKLLAQAKNLKA